MSALKPEYAAVCAGLSVGYSKDAQDAIARVAEICQAIADRPPLMLTDDEIRKVWGERDGSGDLRLNYARAIEAAHIKKQSAPEVVPFNFQLWQQGGWVAIDAAGIRRYNLYSNNSYPSMVREST